MALDTENLNRALIDALGERNVVTSPEHILSFALEPRKRFHKQPLAVATPRSVADLQKLVNLAQEHEIPLVPQGGNTGLVGGQVPILGKEVIVSMRHINAVIETNAAAGHVSVEAGMVLQKLHDIAESAGAIFPLTLASQGSATIGGVLSTNAGGVQVLAYGNARELCLGLDVVLPNGQHLKGLNSLRKNNTGYDLRNLFIGAEGTLGFITAATLKLFPQPQGYETAWVNVTDPGAAYEFFALAKAQAGGQLTAFELMPRFGLDLLLKHQMIARDPSSSRSPWSVLVEISRQQGAAEGTLLRVLETAYEQEIITDAVPADSLRARQAFWSARENMSAVQSREGASIKHDVSVPISAVPELIARGISAAKKVLPSIRPCPFGHLGDGNLHFNFSQPEGMAKDAFMDLDEKLHDAIYDVVLSLGGSVSAEHGIGQLKTKLLAEVKDPVSYALMRQIKSGLDPKGLINPGKIFAN